jgi:hypothetical protein
MVKCIKCYGQGVVEECDQVFECHGPNCSNCDGCGYIDCSRCEGTGEDPTIHVTHYWVGKSDNHLECWCGATKTKKSKTFKSGRII